MGIDLDKLNQTETTAKPIHESSDLATRGGLVGWIREAIIGSIRVKVIMALCVVVLSFFGINPQIAEKLGERFAFFDLAGAKEIVDKEVDEKGAKSTILNIHPIYKSVFAEDFSIEMERELKSVAKFKVQNTIEVLVSKKKFDSMPYGDAYERCGRLFLDAFFPISVDDFKDGMAFQKSWAGNKNYYCMAHIKNLE